MFTGQNQKKGIYALIFSSLLLGIGGGYLLTAPQISEIKNEMLMLNSTLQEVKSNNLYMNKTIIQQEKDINNYIHEIVELEGSLADAEALIANQSEQILNFDIIISKVNTRNSLWIVNNGIEIIEINPKTGDIISKYTIQHMIGDEYHAGWPSGIAHDGEFFWLAAADSDEILKLDPNDMSILSIYDSPGPIPMGLTWDGEYLWCVDAGPNSFTRGRVYKLDHDTLEVVSSFSLSSLEPSGLTWDGNALWIIDEGSETSDPSLHKYDITGQRQDRFYLPIPSQSVGLAWEDDYLWLSFSTFDSESHTEIGEIYKFYPRTHKLIKKYEIPPDSNRYVGLTIAPSSNFWIWNDN